MRAVSESSVVESRIQRGAQRSDSSTSERRCVKLTWRTSKPCPAVRARRYEPDRCVIVNGL